MENLRVKDMAGTQDRNTNLLNAIYGNVHTARDRWLDKVCPVIVQNDFDTCRGGYSDDVIDCLNGYRGAYNTYLNNFENC